MWSHGNKFLTDNEGFLDSTRGYDKNHMHH